MALLPRVMKLDISTLDSVMTRVRPHCSVERMRGCRKIKLSAPKPKPKKMTVVETIDWRWIEWLLMQESKETKKE